MKTLKPIILWLIATLIYAYFSISTTMKNLAVKPSVDLYANELDFQILVFFYTRGVLILLGLGIMLFIFNKYEKRKN